MAESDLSGNLTSEYIFLNGRRIARRDLSGGAMYYYLSDHLGSSDIVTNASGVIQNESDYYPFGVEHGITTNLANQHFKYTGKERDTESGLDYFGARYYASNMGRFMSPDPKQISKQRMLDPQQWNMYSYTRNNPLVAIDPDGKELKLIIVNSSKYSDDTMRKVGRGIAASLTKAGVLNVSVEISHHSFLSKVESLFSTHTHSIEYGPDGGSVGVKETGDKNADGVTATLGPGHSYSGVDTNDTGPDVEKMANLGKHETGHDAGNPDKEDPNNEHPTDPMTTHDSASGTREYTPDEAQKLRDTYNRKDEKQNPPQ